MKNQKIIIISLGGSIIIPRPGEINIRFLKKFRKLILKYIKRGYRFVIIPGGGKVCRIYQKAATKITKVPSDDMDWIGIHTTRLNAQLLRTIFRKEDCPVVLDNPFKEVKKEFLKKPIIIASGWRPGCSTDYDSVLLAKRFKVKEIINAGNIPFAYNKDPFKYKNTKIIKKISWKNYRKLIGSKWIPGLSTPFDPIAAKVAQKLKIRALIIKGTEIKNFEKVLLGLQPARHPPARGPLKFRGTVIDP